MYAVQAAITGNWSWGGFAKSVFMGAVTGAVSGGLGQVFSASGFWASVGNGALAGAGSGGITSIISRQNFFFFFLKGAVIGGAIGGISYTINHYANGNNKTQYTTTDDVNVDGATTVADSRTMNENITTGRSKIDPKITNAAKINSEGVGVSNPEGYMAGPQGKFNILGESTPNFWKGGSDILYSTKAASNYPILGRVMAHETAHSLRFALGLGTSAIQTSFDDSLDTVEHLAIRKLEHVYALKNGISASLNNGYVENWAINQTFNLLHSYQKNLFNRLFNKFSPIFDTKF